MRAVFQRLFGLHPKRAHQSPSSGPSERRPFRGKLGLEVLEDRTAPSVSLLGTPVPGLPPAPDFALPPLTQAPVTVDARLPPPLGLLFGDQANLSFAAPLPDFLSPAGTATMSTSATGALSVTSFAVDNTRLNQQALDVGLSDADGFWSSLLDQQSALTTPSNSDVVHVDLKPFGLELQGIRVQVSQLSLNASFAHPPGLFEAQWSAVMSAVERVVGLLAAALDTAARAVGRAALAIHLPPALVNFFDHLWPPGTVHVFGWSHGPLDLQEPGLDLSAPGFRVDVYADTGPGKTLGNILAALTRVIAEGGGGIENPGGGPVPRVPKFPNGAGAGGFGQDLSPGAGGALVDPMSAPKPGDSDDKSDATPGSGPIVWIVVPVKQSAATQKPFAAVVMSSGAGSKPSLTVERTDPTNRPEVVESKDEHFSVLDDDIPLVVVLPEIGLPDERPIHSHPATDIEQFDPDSPLWPGLERWGNDLAQNAPVALGGGPVEQPNNQAVVSANGTPVEKSEPTGETSLASAADPGDHGRDPQGVTVPTLILLVVPRMLDDAMRHPQNKGYGSKIIPKWLRNTVRSIRLTTPSPSESR